MGEKGFELQIINYLLDLVFPPTCEICGKVGMYLCEKCCKDVTKYELKSFLGNNTINVYKYEDIIRKWIIDYKFNDKAYMCNIFAQLLIKNKKVIDFLYGCDIIIPVPLHLIRRLERGYNQTYLIAKILSKKLKIKVKKDILIKVKNIKPQSEKGYLERREDIKGVFEVKNKNEIKDKNVLIFDDVYTTGSTTKECKRVLLQAGAKRVKVLTISRQVLQKR
ncbi:MAG: ComF family protein [Clostridia bacterium]|nr:ComF family protein [Clostridia bacterium]